MRRLGLCGMTDRQASKVTTCTTAPGSTSVCAGGSALSIACKRETPSW